ncbi:MAG: SDR family oxidoreductase [Alphaproteobacteria bacterium]|nr:SDR family oxidoreductase [Alphaproteobacteria bacterium]
MGAPAIALSVAAFADAAAQSPQQLAGKNCVILGPEGPLARAIGDGLAAAWARVARLYPEAVTEEAYQAALETGPNRPTTNDALIALAAPTVSGAIGTVTPADFRRGMEETYVRTYLAMKYGTRVMRTAGGGAFITVTSATGKRAWRDSAAASAASAGIMHMTRCAALECAAKEDNVRVNAVLVDGLADPALTAAINTVVFLASDAAVYFTSQAVAVDDGDVF